MTRFSLNLKSVSIICVTLVTFLFSIQTNAQKAEKFTAATFTQKKTDCLKAYEAELLDFERNNRYKIPDAKLVQFENQDVWFVGRVTQSEEAFSKVPGHEGTPIATVWIRPKSDKMKKEIKENVYQISLVPLKEVKNSAQLAIRPGSKASYMVSPTVSTTFQGIIMRPLEAQQMVYCNPNRNCTVMSAAIRQQYQALADNNCIIYEVSTRCQITFTAASSCFWHTQTEVVSPKNASCTPPFQTRSLNFY